LDGPPNADMTQYRVSWISKNTQSHPPGGVDAFVDEVGSWVRFCRHMVGDRGLFYGGRPPPGGGVSSPARGWEPAGSLVPAPGPPSPSHRASRKKSSPQSAGGKHWKNKGRESRSKMNVVISEVKKIYELICYRNKNTVNTINLFSSNFIPQIFVSANFHGQKNY